MYNQNRAATSGNALAPTYLSHTRTTEPEAEAGNRRPKRGTPISGCRYPCPLRARSGHTFLTVGFVPAARIFSVIPSATEESTMIFIISSA